MRQYQNIIHTGELKRLYMLCWIFLLMIIGVTFRSFYIQVWNRHLWTDAGNAQYEHRVPLKARRGLIYDRHMNILSMDLPETSLAIDPQIMQEEHIRLLASVSHRPVDEIQCMIDAGANNRYVPLKIALSQQQMDSLKHADIPSLIFNQRLCRVRPYEALGFALLGFTNNDHQGVGGVEQAFDEVLRGEDGWTIYQKDAWNRHHPSVDYPVEKPLHGNHLILTVDHAFQSIIEEELERACHAHAAASGSAVMMDPYTGEILAMVSLVLEPDEKARDRLQARLQNQALQVTYEPGSGFKIVTLAAALEEKIVTPGSLFHCENGQYSITDQIIHDHNKKYEWLTVEQIMEVSSNIGVVKIGRKLGKKNLYKYIRDFGFGNKTGIGLPGEARGILRPVYQWDDFTAAAISFGQGISVTTLQLASMISVIANGGELIQPQIVRAILHDDVPVHQCKRRVIRRVLSESTTLQMRHILTSVVENGSGAEAQVKGVSVAGKTGTAEKSIEGHIGYLPGAHVSSFAGFWPASQPQYALVVVLNEPEKMYWASRSAAPLFSRIVERVCGIPGDLVMPRKKPVYRQAASVFTFSSWHQSMGPKPPPKRKTPEHVTRNQMPDLRGLSLRQALQTLALIDMEARVTGNGMVVSQGLKPGTRLTGNPVCDLICR